MGSHKRALSSLLVFTIILVIIKLYGISVHSSLCLLLHSVYLTFLCWFSAQPIIALIAWVFKLIIPPILQNSSLYHHSNNFQPPPYPIPFVKRFQLLCPVFSLLIICLMLLYIILADLVDYAPFFLVIITMFCKVLKYPTHGVHSNTLYCVVTVIFKGRYYSQCSVLFTHRIM